mmetsp:Transcript_8441/g.19421  ORF Transcript_8441/g.19421 Transcript_8441/m.19421 type:complete len:207 (-) Transcript_8441:510-1130(-)
MWLVLALGPSQQIQARLNTERSLLRSVLLGLGLRVEVVLTQPPQHAEHEPLDAVSNDARAEATPEEANDAVRLHNHLDSLRVRDRVLVRLLGRLDDTDGVGAGVRDGRGGEAHERIPQQLLREHVADGGRKVLGLGQHSVERVVRVEPREMAHERRARRSKRASPEHLRATELDLSPEDRQTLRALHLHGGLDAIDGHEEDAEESS